MIHLASNRNEIEKPSVFDHACRILKEVIRIDPQIMYLWTNGRWQPASLDDVMRRANERRKLMGHEQFANKPEWVVQ